MVSARSLFVAACLLSAVVIFPLVPQVYRKRAKPGGRGLLAVVLGASLFSVAIGLLWSDTGVLVQFVARNLGGLAASVLAVGWVLAIGEYTGTLALSRRVLLAAAAYPVAVTSLAWTNPLHHLYGEPLFDGLTVVALPTGAGLLAHLIAAYLLGVVATVLTVREFLRSRGTRRKQSLALVAGFVPPFLVNVAFVLEWTAFNLTPLGFVATALILWWALVRAEFLDVVPVGRSSAVESMDDPVVTVDTAGRVLDSNAAARDLAGVVPTGSIPVDNFFASVPTLAAAIRDGTSGTVNTDGPTKRWFDLSRSPIHGPQDERRGTVVVLREITRLKRREAELDLLRQIQSRVLRHNIRNDLGVIRAQNELIAERADGDVLQECAETTLETTDDLLAVSAKTRDIERLLDADWETTTIDVGGLLAEIVDEQRAECPGVAFELGCLEEMGVETVPSVRLVLENLVENAAVHNDAAEPRVTVTVDQGGEGVEITIEDNGPGIPDQELAVRDHGEETQLEHGRGVGLWIVDWVERNSAVSVAFETGNGGSTVTVRLPGQE